MWRTHACLQSQKLYIHGRLHYVDIYTCQGNVATLAGPHAWYRLYLLEMRSQDPVLTLLRCQRSHKSQCHKERSVWTHSVSLHLLCQALTLAPKSSAADRQEVSVIQGSACNHQHLWGSVCSKTTVDQRLDQVRPVSGSVKQKF